MSNDTNMNNDKKSISYGAKLKAAREAMGFEQKDVAAQLRLGERIIDMLESGHYAADVPITFVRGYIRSYSKLLQIPDADIAAALEPIQPAPAPQEAPVNKSLSDLTSSNYYMQFSTYAIVATLAGMLGLWWYNHTPSRTSIVQSPSQTLAISEIKNAQENKPVTATAPSTPLAPAYLNATNTAAQSPAPTGPAVATATPATPAAALKPTIATKHVVKKDDDDDEDDDHND